ncbi:S-adenosylmethionine:tRNA ribosyltransferase-isomerase [Rhodocytophaga rosea]|uniref:S-adenosylmethionine:tRNA ribosyltransferase-isomerase n=1 Tax=Rhodocytophaga rosea TaxID=2704465 RepID=A0A6C0GPG8_9BACT|nr:S-adenosylmethionine:tRNA ribosyltransferase-isomerase [Rhodocytophaga rosea]QHT69946.1 S-adenosylmethionine:tRNA ribosyltransferase-isomerase [Rhodocytophaga rosea]
MQTLSNHIIQFDLPEHLSCPQPTEERELLRDEVRLLVTTGSGKISHGLFHNISDYINPGDVLVVNTSATIPSALAVTLPDGSEGVIHLSNQINAQQWLIEIRSIRGNKTVRWKAGEPGMVFRLPGDASITVDERFYANKQLLDLWLATLRLSQPVEDYLAAHAFPIQYEKINHRYPLAYYQTFFSFHPGSAEMPSAGRGFTSQVVDKLLEKGVVFAPVLLHTGVSSLEENEAPYPEYMEISPISAAIINAAKSRGNRIIAVGTTAIRAIESAAGTDGMLRPYRGNTSLFIDENYSLKITDALLTGFHEPRASHLHMLQALAGMDHLELAYQAAIAADYYWHQFGDLHLILP